MSTGNIKNMERMNSQQLESLKRRQYREVKALENNHQNYKAELKTSQELEVADIQDENHRQLIKEAEKKEKVLSGMRSHLHNTQKITDKQLKSLKSSSDAEREKIMQKLTEDKERVVGENQLYLDELNHRFQAESRKVNHEGKNQINDMTSSMNEKYSEQQGHLQKKVNDQSIAFTNQFNHEAKEHKKLKDQVDIKNKHERLSTNQRQQSDMAKLTEANNKFIEQKDVEYRKGLKEQDAFFEQRYLTNHASHTQDANNLNQRYNEMMDKMKAGLSEELTKTNERSDDPFYQFSELRPKWKHTEDGVEIKVSIPEYSKQDIQLSTNHKEVILSFNRSYTDSNKDAEGVSNRVNKIETFTSKIQTGIILNAKTVKASFEDGVMTYNIKKA